MTLLTALTTLTLFCSPASPRKVEAAPTPALDPKVTSPRAGGATSASNKPDPACPHPDDVAAGPAHSWAGKIVRGEKLRGAPEVTLAKLLQAPEAHQGKTVAVEGTVRKACTRKGCWMELAAGEKTPGVRVTFKDFGFFVPLDSAGKIARVEGEVTVATLSEDTAEHYQSEGATVPRGADGAPREVQLVARGVELRTR